jgi:hypothetical protein
VLIIVKGGGGRERKPVSPHDPRMTPQQRFDQQRRIRGTMRKEMRRSKGWDKDKSMRHVASIPPEVHAEVLRNDGAEAARDPKYLIRRCRELGIDPTTGGGRI